MSLRKRFADGMNRPATGRAVMEAPKEILTSIQIVVVGSSWSDMCFICRRTTIRLRRPGAMTIYSRDVAVEKEEFLVEDFVLFCTVEVEIC